jgi:hypothetical protein
LKKTAAIGAGERQLPAIGPICEPGAFVERSILFR